jgi:hypothetical protein
MFLGNLALMRCDALPLGDEVIGGDSWHGIPASVPIYRHPFCKNW